MECEIVYGGDVMKAMLSGEIDHHSVKEVREKIDMELQINRPKTLFLDFGKITFMDSSGIGLVMGRCRKTQLYGGSVEVINPPPYIKKVMKLSGIERLAAIDRHSGDINAVDNDGTSIDGGRHNGECGNVEANMTDEQGKGAERRI